MANKKRIPLLVKVYILLLIFFNVILLAYQALVSEGVALYYDMPMPGVFQGVVFLISIMAIASCLVCIIYEIIKWRFSRSLGWCLFVLVIAFFPVIKTLPKLGSAREKAKRISCASNLRQIVLALQQYAMDFNGWYPPQNGAAGLEILRREEYLSDYKIYVCPSTPDKAGSGNQPLTEDNISYEYYGGSRNDSPKGSVVLRDRNLNHQWYGNVLYADGYVTGVLEKDWTHKIPVR